MTNTTVPVQQARRHLGELIDEAHYLNKPFILTRANKPMAVLFGTQDLARILDLIETYDPGLAETMAIMSNPEIGEILAEGEKAIQKGDMVPFDQSLIE